MANLASLNATKHGGYSKSLILPGEDPAELRALLAAQLDIWRPTNLVENKLVHQMTSLLWRLERHAAGESSLLSIQIQRMSASIDAEFESIDPAGLFALAFTALYEDGSSPSNLARHERTLFRQYQQVRRELMFIRDLRPPASAPPIPPASPEKPQNDQFAETNFPATGENVPSAAGPTAANADTTSEPATPSGYNQRFMSWGYLEDASRMSGHADRICVPKDEEELRALLAEAKREQAPVTIAGGGSGLTGGKVPQGGWLISTEKFRRLDIHKGSATVGAGITLHELHAAAKAANQFYPPDPTETMAFLGGTINCNSSGSRSFKYGATRRWIERLRVVLLDGTVLDVKRGDAIDFDVPEIPQPRAKKHSCGYPLKPGMDWIDLFCGSEGTLGIVTEASVRLLDNPQTLLNGIVFFPDDASCLAALETWRAVPDLRMLEYVDDPALRMIAQRFPVPDAGKAALIIEQIISADRDIDAWADRLHAAAALEEQSWFGTTDADRERFRKFRHALPETALAITEKNGFLGLGTDFSVPDEHNREMLAFYREHMERAMPGHYCIFGHVGDSHAHVNMLPATQAEFDAGTDLLPVFARKAVSLGGSAAAEHGLGKRKAKFLEIQYTPDQIEAMKAVKRRLDPDWRLGRGTLFAIQ